MARTGPEVSSGPVFIPLWEDDEETREANYRNALDHLRAAEILGARPARFDAGDGFFFFVTLTSVLLQGIMILPVGMNVEVVRWP